MATSAADARRLAARPDRIGATAISIGLVIVGLSQVLSPARRPPLYDGVVVEEPYRFVSPGPGEAGNPTSYQTTVAVSGGAAPAIAVATTESPPQAQLIAPAAALVPPTGATQLSVSIQAIAADPADSIVGNAYRVAVTAVGSGEPATIATNTHLTLVLRAPPNIVDARIAQFVGGVWQALATEPGGAQADVYTANVSALGIFAIEATGASLIGLDPRFVALGALVAFGSVVVLLGLTLGAGRGRSGQKVSSIAEATRGGRSRRRRKRR